LTFVTISFLLCGVVSSTPNPQPGGAGYPFLSGSSPLTCQAWEALPVAYTTASIALGIMWPHKPHHYIKVGIPSGGSSISRCKLTVTVFEGQWKTEFMLTIHIRNTIFKEMIQTVQEKSIITSKGMYCHYVWWLLRSWKLWERFFSEIWYGDLYGKNSQQDAGTLCNKAPLLRDMKKWTPRRREFKYPVPKQPRLILLQLIKIFPVLTAPDIHHLHKKHLSFDPT
jgi:hypothetical protein